MVALTSCPYPPDVTALWWEVEGDGHAPVVALLPEASRPAAAWPPDLVTPLVAAGHPVLRLDLRDQGRSPWDEEPFSLADLVGDVGEVLGELAGRLGPQPEPLPVHLVGWGLGGAVALELALAGGGPDIAAAAGTAPPGRPLVGITLAGLTLVGTSGWVVDPSLPGPDEPTAVALVWRSRGGTEEAVLARALGREWRALCGPGERPGPAAALAEATRWTTWGFNPHDRQRAAWLGAPPRWAAAASLAGTAVGTPVDIVHGSDDPLVPVEHGRSLAELTGGRLVEVPGAGHELSPMIVAAVLAAVLGRLGVPGGDGRELPG
jgi:pimeloyl-ACP methyl ester carboxylesterase